MLVLAKLLKAKISVVHLVDIDKKEPYDREMMRMIEEYRAQPEKFERIKTPELPDGSPIGSFKCFVLQ